MRRQPDALESAKAHIRLKEFSAAQAELQRLSESGNPQAEYLLAVFYLNGIAGRREPALARVWLEKAADQGEGSAAYSLAALAANSQPRDDAEVERWLARARQLGFVSPAGAQQAGQPQATSELSAYSSESQSAIEALWLAASRGDLPALRHFATPASVKARDEFGRGALARAAESGKVEAVELLLTQTRDVDTADLHGTTPLMLAAATGNAAVTAALLKAGADPNASDQSHNSVLMHAATVDHPEVIEQLLRAGARIDARNLQDWSALDFAANRSLPGVAARLRAAGATALHHNPARSGELTTVQHPRPPERDLYAGWPDLAVAAALHNTTVLEALLQHGADPNIDAEREPVLAVAALVGRPAAVDELLSAHADPARTDRHGDSALLIAVRSGRADVVHSLLAHGVPADERGGDSEAPLIAAVRSSRVPVVHELIAAH
ncbi:MAG: ankyrin repeat domain-containing protein, partial [Sinobacteraceae bacterium]|nr:ankyrin repeat domain-containing protein [Nevskiaceae bacterium]